MLNKLDEMYKSVIIGHECQWTLCAMMSKSKNGGDSWGTLYGRPMEGLVFCYDRHKEITKYIRMKDMHYHPMVLHMFCLPLKFLAGFVVIPDAIEYKLIFYT